MRLRRPASPVVLAVVFAVIGCLACGGAKEPRSGSAGSASSECTDLLVASSAEISRVIRANDACSTDADCVYVDYSTDCHDSCVGAVARSGEGAIAAAREKVRGAQCAKFVALGCKKSPIPPCVPPLPPQCSSGRCV